MVYRPRYARLHRPLEILRLVSSVVSLGVYRSCGHIPAGRKTILPLLVALRVEFEYARLRLARRFAPGCDENAARGINGERLRGASGNVVGNPGVAATAEDRHKQVKKTNGSRTTFFLRRLFGASQAASFVGMPPTS